MFKMALRNILRNKRRTALTGVSISVAVMIAIYLWSLITGVVDNMVNNMIQMNSGHIKIIDKDYLKRQKMLPLESNIPNYRPIEQLAGSNPNVTEVTGHIRFGVLLEYEGNNEPVIGIGIEPAKENKISGLGQKIINGREIIPGQAETNIGDRLAGKLGLKLGDTLTVVTQTAYGSVAAMNLKVVGIFRFGVPSIDGKVFYLPLGKAQELLDLGDRVTEIFVLIKNMNKAPQVAAEIQTTLNKAGLSDLIARPWQSEELINWYFSIAKTVYGVIYVLILFLASFTILNTMFMAVLERTKEIGMMKALGLKNRQVVGIVIYEAAIIGFFASFVGAIWGSGIAYYLTVVGLDFTAIFNQMGEFNLPISYIYRAVFRFPIIFTGFCLGIAFSILAAIPPAFKAAKMEPTEALREL